MTQFSEQLGDFAVRLSGEVAQRLLELNMKSEPDRRKIIEQFVVDQLPDIITNALIKTPSFHTAEGLKYAEQNFEKMVNTYVQSLLGKI